MDNSPIQTFLSTNELTTLTTALRISIKNSHLSLRLDMRLICKSFDIFLCRNPPSLRILLTSHDFLKALHGPLIIGSLHSLLSKVRISDLQLHVPGPTISYNRPRGSSKLESEEYLDIGKKFYGLGTPLPPAVLASYHKQRAKLMTFAMKLKVGGSQRESNNSFRRPNSIIPLILPDTLISLHVIVTGSFGGPTYSMVLPKNLLNLDLKNSFNQVIKPNLFPPTITTLKFESEFNQDLENLPMGLLHLDTGAGFNQSISNLINLTPNLQSLVLGYNFNRSFGLLPQTLRSLSFDYYFDYPIDSLPEALTILKLSIGFNQPMYHLPSSLISLEMSGLDFDHPIDNLPPNLKHLIIRNISAFDRSIDNLPNLETLTVCQIFNQNLDNLPDSLRKLEFRCGNGSGIGCSWHTDSNLENTMSFPTRYPIDHLPSSLIELTLPLDFNLIIDNLPSNLQILNLGCSFNQSINSLPQSLTHLTLGESFNQEINHLPSSLKFLKLGRNFIQGVDHLPNGLTDLILGKFFDQPIDNLPSSLSNLKLGNYFDKSINRLPPNLKTLFLGSFFNQSIDNLPNSIEILRLGKEFSLGINYLPTSLKKLFICVDSDCDSYVIRCRKSLGMKLKVYVPLSWKN